MADPPKKKAAEQPRYQAKPEQKKAAVHIRYSAKLEQKKLKNISGTVPNRNKRNLHSEKGTGLATEQLFFDDSRPTTTDVPRSLFTSLHSACKREPEVSILAIH